MLKSFVVLLTVSKVTLLLDDLVDTAIGVGFNGTRLPVRSHLAEVGMTRRACRQAGIFPKGSLRKTDLHEFFSLHANRGHLELLMIISFATNFTNVH